MANSRRNQALACCAQRALIVITITIIMSLCASTKHIASSHHHLHLNKTANTTTITTAANQHPHQRQSSEATATNRSTTEANHDDDHNGLLERHELQLPDLDRLFALGLERVLRMFAETDEDNKHSARFRRQLSELELIKELNDTKLAGEQNSPPATQRQRGARAKKQAASTTPQPSYSSPSVTGDNPVSAYAMATTPASSVDAPQSVEVQVTNEQQQSVGGPNEAQMMNDLADTLAIETTRPPGRPEKHSPRKQSASSGGGDLHHYKLSKVPGPEHNPMKEIRVNGNLNEDSSLGLDESAANQDQTNVNSLAEAIGAELANRQPEVGADDAALLDQLTKPNFLATNLPLKRDKRPVQSMRPEDQPFDYQQSYQNNQQRQSLFPVESMANTGAPSLAPYTFDQNMALLNTGNMRQQLMNSYSNPMALSEYGLNPTLTATTIANASRASGHNWSVPLTSSVKGNKNSRTKTASVEMTNDLGNGYMASNSNNNNSNNDDLSMLFHNSKMQNKRAGLALAAENLKNNLLLPYQQPFTNRFSFAGSGNKKVQQQQQLGTGSNAAASAPYRHFLNPLAVVSGDQTRSSQETIYGDQFAPALVTQQGGANQNPVLGMLRVAPSQLNAAISGAIQQQQQQQRAPFAPLVRRNSPLALLSGGNTNDFLPHSASAAYLAATAAARYSRQQQSPQHRTISAYQHRIGRHEPGANPNYDDGGGGGGQPAASVPTTSTSDPMWSDTQNHEEDYQQSPQTIQITAVPNGLGLANPNFVGNGLNGFNGFGGGWNGWGGPWGGRQVLLVNKQPQQVGTEWRSWLIPVAIILALPLILGALFIPVFLKSVMFLIQILQMLGLLMPPSQLASHLLSNTHGSQSG